ncbi:hypothetical protein AVEN_98537-1, partial [Araneus ventricosus]
NEDLTKNVDATGESLVCSLVHRVHTAKLADTVWKASTVPTNSSGLVYVIYGNR